jgi:hypothetical protein
LIGLLRFTRIRPTGSVGHDNRQFSE